MSGNLASAESVAMSCAALLQPSLFEPHIKKAAEALYEHLLYSVEDYLKENTEYNINQRIASAEARARNYERELLSIDNALSRYSMSGGSRVESIAKLQRSLVELKNDVIRLEDEKQKAFDLGYVAAGGVIVPAIPSECAPKSAADTSADA